MFGTMNWVTSLSNADSSTQVSTQQDGLKILDLEAEANERMIVPCQHVLW